MWRHPTVQPACFSAFSTLEKSSGHRQLKDAHSALELLVLASIYNVPYLVQAAEVALKNRISNSNCFILLTVAAHHDAQQLRSFSTHYSANGFKLLSKSAGYKVLSEDLVREVERVRATLE